MKKFTIFLLFTFLTFYNFTVTSFDLNDPSGNTVVITSPSVSGLSDVAIMGFIYKAQFEPNPVPHFSLVPLSNVKVDYFVDNDYVDSYYTDSDGSYCFFYTKKTIASQFVCFNYSKIMPENLENVDYEICDIPVIAYNLNPPCCEITGCLNFELNFVILSQGYFRHEDYNAPDDNFYLITIANGEIISIQSIH